jgi:small subunit ribosomal protein S15
MIIACKDKPKKITAQHSKSKKMRTFTPKFLIVKENIMYLDSEKKKEIFAKYGKSNTDTGSSEGQIALFSYRISHLTEHLKLNKKDYSTERSLKMLVGKRRRLLDYLKDRDIERYRSIIKELGIRK